jgi:hypothetical protein
MRGITVGRRLEALPTWTFALFVVTLAAVVLAAFFGLSERTAPDGTRCGAAFVPLLEETPEQQMAGCQAVLADEQPLAWGLIVLAAALVVLSALVIVVRGWKRQEPAPWPGG